MKKLATLEYDVTDLITSGKIDYLIAITKGKDDLIKHAHVPSLEEAEELPDSKFALVLYHPHVGKMKKLAMSDKYLTELNMRIFEDRMDSLPELVVKTAATNLCKAAKHYKLAISDKLKSFVDETITTNWVNIAEIKNEQPRVKLAKVTYALNGKYPISTAALVKKAMSYFDTHWRRFSPLNAFEYAINVKTAAEKFNVDYSNTLVEKYAHIDPSKLSKHFKTAMLARKGYVSEEVRETYDELIKKASELGPVQTAKVLEALDREAGINREWNHSIKDPIFTVFDTVLPTFTKHANVKISSADLQKIPNGLVDDATLADLKGPEGIEVFDSLPKPIKDQIVKKISG